MAEYWVTAVRLNEQSRITHLKVCLNDPNSSDLGDPVQTTVYEVAKAIVQGNRFYTTQKNDGMYERKARVSLYLHSWPDDSRRDNLDNLPLF